MAVDQRTLFKNTQSVMRKLDEVNASRTTPTDREAMIVAVAETYRTEGREVDMAEIEQVVDQVIAEELEQQAKPRKKIPTHIWVLGAVIAIPLIVPLLRLTEALVALLLRIFI